MYKLPTYLVVTYSPPYLPIHDTYFLQNWLPRWNQILTQLRFIHNWVKRRIQWMVQWWVMVYCGPCRLALLKLEGCSRWEGDKLLHGCVAFNASYATSFLKMDLSSHFLLCCQLSDLEHLLNPLKWQRIIIHKIVYFKGFTLLLKFCL